MIEISIAIIIAIAIIAVIVNSTVVAVPNAQSASNGNQSAASSSNDQAAKKKQAQSDVTEIQHDLTELQTDVKQIQIDLSPQQTLVQSGVPQNPSIQQSLPTSQAQSQHQLTNLGTLQAEENEKNNKCINCTGTSTIKSDWNRAFADFEKLKTDEQKFAPQIDALFRPALTTPGK